MHMIQSYHNRLYCKKFQMAKNSDQLQLRASFKYQIAYLKSSHIVTAPIFISDEAKITVATLNEANIPISFRNGTKQILRCPASDIQSRSAQVIIIALKAQIINMKVYKNLVISLGSSFN